MKVENELGVIVKFAQQCEEHGWEIVSIQSQFPDVIIKSTDQDRVWLAEFEYQASSFKAHKHDLRECDVIICWINDWSDCPITIWALSESGAWSAIENQPDEQIEIYQLKRENELLKKHVRMFSVGAFYLDGIVGLDLNTLTILETIVFDVLNKENADICSHDKLKAALWDDTEADNGRLEKLISRLREKLDGSAFRILTIRGRGYKLVGLSSEVSASSQDLESEIGYN